MTDEIYLFTNKDYRRVRSENLKEVHKTLGKQCQLKFLLLFRFHDGQSQVLDILHNSYTEVTQYFPCDRNISVLDGLFSERRV